MISGSKFQHNKQILLQALLLSQIILMLSSKGTKAKVRSKNIERSENLETTPDPWEGFDNTTLDTLQHAKQPWIVSSEHPIVPYWIIYIENYAGIDEALKKYATDITGLNLTNLEGNWMGSWAAFNINGSDPPYSRIRYPAIEYKRRIQVPAFEYIEITYFLHGQAYILVNTTTGPNHLINISSSDGTDEWITKTFSLQGHRVIRLKSCS